MTEIGSAIGYGMQKFHEAVDALIYTGGIQERLRQAGVSLFYLKPESHLPDELRSQFLELREEIGRAESLGDEEACQLASRVLEMARSVDREYFKWEDSVL